MSQGIHLRKYGVETKIGFDLYEIDGVDLRVDAADAGTDCAITKDEGAETTCTNDFVDEGSGYSITLTATEMQAARIVLFVIDSATKVWLDKVVIIETYGNASAQHALDLDDADGSTFTETGGDGAQLTEAGGDGDHLTESGGTGDQFSGLPRSESDLTYIHGTALTETAGQLAAAFIKFFDVAAPTATALSLPDAVPDAAGGLPISDAGGLDIDTKLANTNEVTAARMGALTDWINGGRLDLILDIIAVDTTTDIPALLATIDTVVDAIKVVTDNMSASATTLVTGIVEEGGGPTTTVFQTDLAEATDDHYNGRVVIFTSGANQNQATDITDYTGATGTITVTAMTAAPAANDTFVIV